MIVSWWSAQTRQRAGCTVSGVYTRLRSGLAQRWGNYGLTVQESPSMLLKFEQQVQLVTQLSLTSTALLQAVGLRHEVKHVKAVIVCW